MNSTFLCYAAGRCTISKFMLKKGWCNTARTRPVENSIYLFWHTHIHNLYSPRRTKSKFGQILTLRAKLQTCREIYSPVSTRLFRVEFIGTYANYVSRLLPKDEKSDLMKRMRLVERIRFVVFVVGCSCHQNYDFIGRVANHQVRCGKAVEFIKSLLKNTLRNVFTDSCFLVIGKFP